MKKLTSLAFAAFLATTGTAAFAEQDIQKGTPVGPVAMTDAQMDNVAAGALLTVVAVDLLEVDNVLNNNRVQVPITAPVSVAVLGTSAAGALTRAGQR